MRADSPHPVTAAGRALPYREDSADVPVGAVGAIALLAVGALGLGLGLQAAGGPWTAWILLWWVGSLATWRLVARRPVRDLFAAPPGTWWRDLLVALAVVGAGRLGLLGLSAWHGTLIVPATIAPATWGDALVLAFVVSGLVNAVPEEVTFRGVLQRLVGSRAGGLASAVLVGLFFGLAHLPTLLAGTMGADVNLAVEVGGRAAWGVFVGWAAWRLRSLWFALGWHVGGNVLGTGLGALGFRGVLDGAAPGWGELVDPTLLLGIGAVLLLARARRR